MATDSKGNNNTSGYVYLIKEFHTNTYKIGKTKTLKNRLKIFHVKLPFEWELVHFIKSDEYSILETLAHEYFSDKRVRGEWFNLSDSDIEFIKREDFIIEIKKSLNKEAHTTFNQEVDCSIESILKELINTQEDTNNILKEMMDNNNHRLEASFSLEKQFISEVSKINKLIKNKLIKNNRL